MNYNNQHLLQTQSTYGQFVFENVFQDEEHIEGVAKKDFEAIE